MDHPFDGGGNQEVDLGCEQVFVADRVGFREAEHRPGVVYVTRQGRDVEAGIGADRAVLVGYRDDADAGLVEETCRVPTDLPEALHCGGGTLGFDATRPQRGQCDVHDPARCRCGAAQRTAETHRLSGGDTENGVPCWAE